MVDVYIHQPESVTHEIVWRFVKKARVKLSENFGMAFDPVTGEDYPADDPRRG